MNQMTSQNNNLSLPGLFLDQVEDIDILEREWAIVDIETSDAYLKDGRIIEIAIIIVKDFKVIKTFKTVINPLSEISPFIQNLTGISNEDVEAAPTFESLCLEIYNLLENRLFIAHNASFDYNFIKDEFTAININFNENRLCSVKLSKSLFPEYRKHSLDTIVERHNLIIKNRHRAYDDAYAVFKFLEKLKNEVGEKNLKERMLKSFKRRVS